MSGEFVLRYDGLSAAKHSIDMRLLGRSLVGVDEAVHRSLWLAVHPDIPRGRKRLEVAVEVQAPRAACVEILGALSGVGGVLPFAHELATSLGVDYIKHMLSAVVFWHGGRQADAQAHMDKALDIIREAVAHQNASMETAARMHEASLAAMVEVVKASQAQAKAIVAPVGPSVDTLKIGAPGLVNATVIDAAVADAVRSGEPLEVGDMEKLNVRFDALVRHSRTARVELPDEPGRYYPAEIRDPAYDSFPNAYSEAFNAGDVLEVAAKLSRRENGELVRLHILDAAKAAS